MSHRDWLEWAGENGVHPRVVEYIQTRPDHLWSQPPKHEEPFSSPRSWHMLSDVLISHGESLADDDIEAAAYGCLSPAHAGQFKAFVKQFKSKYRLAAILKGEIGWPTEPEDRDILYFLAQSFRAQLLKDLPRDRTGIGESHKATIHKAKGLIKSLASISLEMAQMVVASPSDVETLPEWFLTEIVRDLPRLVEGRDGAEKTKN